TVRPDDLVDFAASVMHWKHIRHVPVEDEQGRLLGLVSHRALLQLLSQGMRQNGKTNVTVREIMKQNPITVRPGTPTIEAIEIMRRHLIGSLPVVEDDRLVGLVTAYDLLSLSAILLEKYLSKELSSKQET